MNLSDRMVDVLTQEDLALNRVQAAAVRDVERGSNALRGKIADELKRIDPTEPARTSDQRNRAAAAVTAVSLLIDADYRRMESTHRTDSAELLEEASERTSNTLNEAIGVGLFAAWLAGRQPQTKRRLIGDALDEVLIPNEPTGVVLKARWTKNRLGLKEKIGDAINAAVNQGRNLSDLLTTVRGTARINYTDGLLHPSKQGLMRLVKTAHTQYVQASRLKTWERNTDIIRGVQSLAVLDNRTSNLCLVRNGMAWSLPDYKAFPGTAHSYPGPPPWHYLCRSGFMPIVRSLDSLRRSTDRRLHAKLDKLNHRYPIDGKPAEVIGLDGWIRRAERQGIDVGAQVGRGRLKLYKEKHLTPDQLVSQTGQELTLKELEALD